MNEEPRTSAEEMIDRLSPELSRWRRLRGVTALLAGTSGAVFTVALWATEPGPLPERTRLSFALLTAVCLAWTGYGAWTVTRRAPLFALDRVVAAWLAVGTSSLTAVVTVAIAAAREGEVLPALAAGAALVAASALLAVRAHARRRTLLRRKRELAARNPR